MKGITLNEIIALVESLDFEFEFIQNLQTETKNHSEFSDKEVSELFWRKKIINYFKNEDSFGGTDLLLFLHSCFIGGRVVYIDKHL